MEVVRKVLTSYEEVKKVIRSYDLYVGLRNQQT